MMNPEGMLGPQDPPTPPFVEEDFTEGTLPPAGDQPETQGEDPIEAEIGEDGQGDLDQEGHAEGPDAPTDLRDGTD